MRVAAVGTTRRGQPIVNPPIQGESGPFVSWIASAMYRHSDEIIVSARAVAKRPSVAAVVPIMAVVFIAFLIIGLALPVLPLQVHQGLASAHLLSAL